MRKFIPWDGLFVSAIAGWWGYQEHGVYGMLVYSVSCLLLLEVLDALVALYTVRQYYWNNAHRSRWNAFCYLKGWVK